MLKDPHLCQIFQNEIWEFQASQDADVDLHLQEFEEFLKSKSLKIFGTMPRRPRQCWMSAATWTI
eukprot:3354241-Karenia_brevis.AAC.1